MSDEEKQEEKPKADGIEVTAGELVDAREAVEVLKRLSLTRSSSYLAARLIKKLLPEMETLEEARLGLVNEYLPEELHGVPDQHVPPTKMPEFNRRWKEVRAQKIVVSGVQKIRVADLKVRAGAADVPPIVFTDLAAFIQE